ncbi:MAG: hypothetical protein KatS3mg060_3229 [Dehalococcoidia bacterium]|nr:MAG: hypothetical protein KatS3mg060_3229 [Dehalococcoidia bacterium]
MIAAPLAPPEWRRFAGLAATLAAAAFVVWAALTTERPLWAEPASPTSYARGDWILQPGETFDTPLDPRGADWSGLEIRPSGGESGPLDFAVLDGESVRASGRLLVDGAATLFIPVQAAPDDTALRLRLTRPAESGPLSIRVQHREGPPLAVYQWVRRWAWREVAAGVAQGLLTHALLIGTMLTWLLAPGWLLWRWLGRPLARPRWPNTVALLALWPAISVAVLVVLGALWSFGPVRLAHELATLLLRAVAFVLACAGGVALARWMAQMARGHVVGHVRSRVRDGSVALAIVAVGIVLTRAGALVGIGGAPGVDSTSVTDFARLIQQRGALLDVSPAAVAGRADFYHLGLSGLVALVSGTAGAPLDWSFLAVGQALQVAALFGLVLLVRQWGGGAWSSAAALFVAGLVLPLPGFVLAWSRFTQIAGLALVPPLFAVAAWTLAARRPARFAAALGLLGGGLALTHYRAFAFALAAAPLLLLWPPPGLCVRWRNVGVVLLALTGTVVVLAPWLVGVAVTFWAPAVADGPAGPQEFQAWTLQYDGTDWVLAALCLASGAALLLGRRSTIARPLLPIVWSAAVLALFTWFGVAGLRLGLAVNPLSAAIAYYLPIGLWAAWTVAALGALRLRARTLAQAATVASLGLVLLTANRPSTLGARLGDLLFYDDADRRALDWLARELPADAQIANNGEPWAYSLYVGTDGGYWTRIVTGRESLVPPLSYSFRSPDELVARNAAIEETIRLASRPDELVKFLRRAGWTHLYLGKRGGPIDPLDMARLPGLRLLYQRDGVSIWELGR